MRAGFKSLLFPADKTSTVRMALLARAHEFERALRNPALPAARREAYAAEAGLLRDLASQSGRARGAPPRRQPHVRG